MGKGLRILKLLAVLFSVFFLSSCSTPATPDTENAGNPSSADAHLSSDTGSAKDSGTLDFDGPSLVPTRIIIPKIGVDEAIQPARTAANGGMAVPTSPAGITWYEPGPSPGWEGNALLAGHASLGGVPGTLAELKNLEVGDSVQIFYEDGSYGDFEVTSTTVYLVEDMPIDIMRLDGERRTTLITNDGKPMATGGYDSRLIVILRALDRQEK